MDWPTARQVVLTILSCAPSAAQVSPRHPTGLSVVRTAACVQLETPTVTRASLTTTPPCATALTLAAGYDFGPYSLGYHSYASKPCKHESNGSSNYNLFAFDTERSVENAEQRRYFVNIYNNDCAVSRL